MNFLIKFVGIIMKMLDVGNLLCNLESTRLFTGRVKILVNQLYKLKANKSKSKIWQAVQFSHS